MKPNTVSGSPTLPTNSNQEPTDGSRETAILLLVQLLFGFSYVSSKVMVLAMPPLVWVCIRTWSSALLLVPLAWYLRGPAPKIAREDWWKLIGLAFIGSSFNQATFLMGLERTTAANSAVLSCLIPVFTLLVSILKGREKWSLGVSLSFLFAFLGSLVVVDFTRLELGRRTLQGDLLIILNAASYGTFLALAGNFLRRYDRLWATTYFFIVGGVFLAFASIPDWMNFQMPESTTWFWGHAIYALIGANFIPYILINSVLVRVAPSKVALFVFFQPVVAGISGWLVLGTALTWRWAIGSVLVFAGVFLSYWKSIRNSLWKVAH